MRFISQAVAKTVDERLMSVGGFSIDQLMELAGLSVAECFSRLFPPTIIPVVVCGPGNNGGYLSSIEVRVITSDGLVAARHLAHFGYEPQIVYPKQTRNELYLRLQTQCKQLDIPISEQLGSYHPQKHAYIDGIFGFGFAGEVRAPFDSIIATMNVSAVPILSIDIPSGWHVAEGNISGLGLNPDALISLTAPKLCAQTFKGRHFVGGRFVPKWLADELSFDVPVYQGTSQIAEIYL